MPIQNPRSCLGAFALLLITVLTGCSNNPYPPGETARPILYRVLLDPPRHIDPVNAYTVDEARVIDNVYGSYYKYDYLKRDPFKLDLLLGEREPEVKPTNGGGEEWTFHIKHGLKFQDDPCFPGGKGREILAKDFVFSFKRMADPTNICPVVSFFSDKVIGFGDYCKHCTDLVNHKQPVDYGVDIPGLQLDKNDPYSFKIILNQPYPQLRFLMCMHFTSPIPFEAINKYKNLSKHTISSNAFMITEYNPKEKIVLKENPNRPLEYYPTEGTEEDRKEGLLQDAGKQLPLIKEIHFSIIKESITGWNMFVQGYLDSAGVSSQNYNQVVTQQGTISPEMAKKGVIMRKDVETDVYYLIFNMTDPVVGGYTPEKQKLRQAISMAIDSQTYIDLLSHGIGKKPEFLIPPGLFGYDPKFKNPYRDNNLEKAKQLLAEAGYPGGIDRKTGDRLTLFYDNTATDAAGRQVVGLFQKYFNSIGINLSARPWQPNIWQDRVDNGQFQIITYGWVADYPDPENFMFLLYSKNKRPGPNHSAYNNPEYDKLFEKMRSMNDGPERLTLINKMRDIAVQDSPLVYLEHSESLSIHYSWLKNVKPHPISNDYLKYENVDSTNRERLQKEWNQPKYGPVAAFFGLLILGSLPAIRIVNNRKRRHIRKQSGNA